MHLQNVYRERIVDIYELKVYIYVCKVFILIAGMICPNKQTNTQIDFLWGKQLKHRSVCETTL